MTIQIELSPETEARLANEAALHNIPPEKYAGKLLQEALETYASGTGVLTVEDIEAMTAVMTEGSEHLPVLAPEATERASFYEDRW